jgi:hypothetical protein
MRTTVVIASMFLIISCVYTPQNTEMGRINSEIQTASQDIDRLKEEAKQLETAEEITSKKELALLSSMGQQELSIYDKLKTSLLQRDSVKLTLYAKELNNYLNTNYPPGQASTKYENIKVVLTEIEKNAITRHNLNIEYQKQSIRLDSLGKQMNVYAPRY